MVKKLLSRLRGSRPTAVPELLGRPAIRREKAYPADSGYVYQYTYEGYRAASREGAEGQEFVFRCTSGRRSWFSLTVFAPDSSFAAWERSTIRELNPVERYAIVKMQLFEIFDESAHVDSDEERQLTAEQVERHIEALDL